MAKQDSLYCFVCIVFFIDVIQFISLQEFIESEVEDSIYGCIKNTV